MPEPGFSANKPDADECENNDGHRVQPGHGSPIWRCYFEETDWQEQKERRNRDRAPSPAWNLEL